MGAGTLVSSGSSLNMPTGSGSERLRRAHIHGLSNAWQEIFTGVAGHIYTILLITFTDQETASGILSIKLNNGTNDVYLTDGQSYGAGETFVWNDKFVIEEDDDIDVFNSSTNGDWTISYIDQDWT